MCLGGEFYRLAQKYKQMQLHKSDWTERTAGHKNRNIVGTDRKVHCMGENHIRKFHWAKVASRGLQGLHSPQGGPDKARPEMKQFKWAGLQNKIIQKISI